MSDVLEIIIGILLFIVTIMIVNQILKRIHKEDPKPGSQAQSGPKPDGLFESVKGFFTRNRKSD